MLGDFEECHQFLWAFRGLDVIQKKKKKKRRLGVAYMVEFFRIWII